MCRCGCVCVDYIHSFVLKHCLTIQSARKIKAVKIIPLKLYYLLVHKDKLGHNSRVCFKILILVILRSEVDKMCVDKCISRSQMVILLLETLVKNNHIAIKRISCKNPTPSQKGGFN